MFYVSLMVTTKEKLSVVGSQNTRVKESKHTATKSHHSQNKVAREEAKNKGSTKRSENNKKAIVSLNLSIITLSIIGLNS